jgi:ketosteroid isomerase-like protein
MFWPRSDLPIGLRLLLRRSRRQSAVMECHPQDMAPHRSRQVARLFRAIEEADLRTMRRLMTRDVTTTWPQTGERFSGPERCAYRHASLPGGAYTYRLARVVGDGDTSTAELVARRNGRTWYLVAVIEFTGETVDRLTEYFCPNDGSERDADLARADFTHLEYQGAPERRPRAEGHPPTRSPDDTSRQR